jgi:cyclin C
VIQKLCKRLGLRQQVIATAIVYFRRFYLRNSYSDTDCALVAAACCYVAAKAEETPVHVKSAVAEARVVFNGECVKSGAKCRDLTRHAASHRHGTVDVSDR